MMKLKNYKDLSVHEKINIKQYAINVYGKRWHTEKPNFISKLKELQISSIFSYLWGKF